MNSIDHCDIESYIRSLVFEGFGKQSEDSVQSKFGQSSDPDPKAPSSILDLTNNKKKNHRKNAGS